MIPDIAVDDWDSLEQLALGGGSANIRADVDALGPGDKK